MAREIFIEGVQYTEDGGEEYFIEGVQANEDQAVTGGRIMSSLVGAGGLAGMGGIAGQGGGLVA